MADNPIFIDTELQTIASEMAAKYQELTGRILHPAQVEQLMLNTWAYRENIIRSSVQNACLQNLVDFAVAPNLDYLGVLVGVRRLGSSSATCTIRITLIETHGSGMIPSGKRISSTDGQVTFATSESVEYTAEDTYIDVEAYCMTPGTSGNGYTSGMISKLMDAMAVISTVSNTNTTAGGSDDETDQQLRERIKLAPEAFSCAGSRQSYEFWAKTASSTIIDVYVTSDDPGIVVIYPLVSGGIETPEQILSAVLIICSAEKVRPLCDTVVAVSPTRIDWDLDVEVQLEETAVWEEVSTLVEEAINQYDESRSSALGSDIVVNSLIGLIMAIPGVADITDISLSANVECQANEFPKLGTLNVTQYE